jgi:hypothetical protein
MKTLLAIAFFLFAPVLLAAQTNFVVCYDGTDFETYIDFEDAGVSIPDSSDSVDFEGGTLGECTDDGDPQDPGVGLDDPKIQYQGGTLSQRRADLIVDPTDASNRVLEFWADEPNVGGTKTRVQWNQYDSDGVYTLYQSTRMYLSSGWDLLPDFSTSITGSGGNWITVAEFWNDANWLFPDTAFRISVNVNTDKSNHPGKLLFEAHGQLQSEGGSYYDTDVWVDINESFYIPTETWMLVEYVFIEGDADNGVFKMYVTPDGGARTEVFNVTNYTHHPTDPSPDGLVRWNPVKMYLSDDIIDYVRGEGSSLQILWDDLTLSSQPLASGPTQNPQQTCAGTAEFSWGPPTGETVGVDFDGYSLRIDGVERYKDTGTSKVLSTIPNVVWSAGSTYTFDVRTYTGTEYSQPTISVRFLASDDSVIDLSGTQACTFVTAVPTAPDNPVITP